MRTKYSEIWGNKLANALGGAGAKEVTEETLKGGPGSGHYGHAGRPGEIGGSAEGGVEVGRRGTGDSDKQFKFSGSAKLSRAKGAAEVHITSGKVKGKFEVRGAVDGRGRQKLDGFTLHVNGKNVEIDQDEMHALRTHMRYLNGANKRETDPRIVRGNAVTVKVGDKSVTIPVNDKTVKAMLAFHGGAKEPKGEIRAAVKAMETGNPIKVVKERGFSKAGQLAAFFSHVERHTTSEMETMIKRVPNKLLKVALTKQMNKIVSLRGEGRKARKELSGTQAIKSYKAAAARMTEFLGKTQRKGG
jgi:hypothetical protein